MKTITKKISLCAGLLAVLCVTVVLICDQLVVSNAKGKAFSDIDSIKYNGVGLLLGTTPQSRFTKGINYFFVYRIDAAEQLYKAGKIDKILISGDENSLDGVNEAECMRDSLVARGVPTSAIILDGKGYRTICSVVNANKVYDLKSFIIISQKFHNERAIYQAEHLGLDVENIQAYNAKEPTSNWALITYIREYFARVKMFWDIHMGKQSDALGEDSLINVHLKYNQIVNGYEVTAKWMPFNKMSETGTVVMNFHNIKTGKDYKYYSYKYNSYDTDKISFSKGFKGYNNGDVYYFNYTKPDTLDHFKEYNGNSPLGYYTPFQFLDIDFDGEEELLIHDWYQGQVGNDYEVYKLTDSGLQKQRYIPLDRLTNVDMIDLERKTIAIVDDDGAYDSATFYFSNKKREHEITDVPNFYSECASGFDFEKYNSELGVPFVLDSIKEYAKTDAEHHALYIVQGSSIARK